jgi:hypothetical protein
MTLISILGDVGSGKTLLATFLALYETRPVFANYEIRIKNWHMLKPEKLNTLSKSLGIIDELYAWGDSRTSGALINRYMSYIIFQLRKRESDIIVTDQIEGVIDTRFRQMTNYKILAQNLGDGFEYWVFKRTVFGLVGPTKFLIPMEMAEQIFPYYDTMEKINPIDDAMMFKISTDHEDDLSIVDSIVDELRRKTKGQRIDKGIIADYCLRNKHPHYLVELVANAIKAKSIGL